MGCWCRLVGRVLCRAFAWLGRDGTIPSVRSSPEVSIRRDHSRQIKSYKVVRCGEIGIALRRSLFSAYTLYFAPISAVQTPRPTLRVRMRENRWSSWIDQTEPTLATLTFGVGRGHFARAQIKLRIARSVGLPHRRRYELAAARLVDERRQLGGEWRAEW